MKGSGTRKWLVVLLAASALVAPGNAGAQTPREAPTDPFGAKSSDPTTPEREIEVGNSAPMYVADAAGTIVLTWPYGTPAQSLADYMHILLSRRAA